MARQIKFRVWDESKKEYSLEPRLSVSLLNSEPYVCYMASFGKTIQFFTGLSDKNGKEIYEGDIVLDLDKEYGVIEFSNGSFILNTKNRILPFWSILVHENMVYPRQMNTHTLELCGNIYENSELLTK